ncbi:MAG: hypothetical protein R2824_14190 [Saprospiraceae bacterium]|nr:hypothetical protein [Lewinella sp.]
MSSRSVLWAIGLLAFSFYACGEASTDLPKDEGIPAYEEILPGTWEAVSMYVEVNSAENVADSNYVFQINEGDWRNVFSVSPPVSYFEKDHKYRIERRDRRDSVMDVSRGIWNIMGDTLMMIESKQSFQYLISYEKGLLYFMGIRDWDGDGEMDDHYQEVRRRVSIGTE